MLPFGPGKRAHHQCSLRLPQRGGRQGLGVTAERLSRLTMMPSCLQWTLRVILRGQNWPTHPHGLALTLFKLDPHTSIILDLLDHLSATANDHANRMPGHWHLREGGRQKAQWVSPLQLICRPRVVVPHPHPMALHLLEKGPHSHQCPRQSGIHIHSGPQSHPGHAPGGYPSPSHMLAANTQSWYTRQALLPTNTLHLHKLSGPRPTMRTDIVILCSLPT